MARNPKKVGANAGNTFTRAEIEAVVQLLTALYAGRDVTVILRNPDVGKLYGKFKRMKHKLDILNEDLADDDDG